MTNNDDVLFSDKCLHCTMKHLCQALVLDSEVVIGYLHHKYLIIGNLAEAEREAPSDLVHEIRLIRKHYMLTCELRKDLILATLTKLERIIEDVNKH